MKNRTVFLGAFICAALILSGCGQKSPADQSNNATAPTGANQSSSSAGNSSSNSAAKSLKDLMAMGKNLECTWSATDDKGKKSTGIVDISGQKFKMTIESENPNGSGTMKFYTMNDGTWIYSWGDMMKGTGMKMKTADAEQLGKDAQSGTPKDAPGQTQDWQKDYNYSCNPWQISDSMFVVPSDVNFMDAANLMKGIKGAPQGPANLPNIQQ